MRGKPPIGAKGPTPQTNGQAKRLPPIEVDGLLYDRYGVPGASAVSVPGIPESEDQDPADVAPIMVPVDKSAYPVTVTILLRQVNRFVGEAGNARVAGASQWAITLNNALVYCPSRQPRSSLSAMVAAIDALGKLMVHPVRWWDERSWQGRPVWFQGVPAVVTHFWPDRGMCGLVAVDGYAFMPQGSEIEAGLVEPSDPRQVIMVDILSTEVHWTRTKDHRRPTNNVPADTQADVPMVHSEDESTEGEDDEQDG